MSCLEIIDLHVQVQDKKILKGINLIINEHEIHALMGPNGNGKSTLLQAIMGNPKYTITRGDILFNNKSILALSVDERAKLGLFLGMQYPVEISGVNNSDFLKACINARREKPISLFAFIKEMEAAIKKMQLKEDVAHRFLNEGFSGGEKKRNEIVQMMMLKPTFSMFDEIDSGLDVDALHIVAEAIQEAQTQNGMGMLIVSHYARFYDLFKPTHTHILMDGKIVTSSDASLIKKIDQEGYEWVSKAFNVTANKQERKKVELLGTCGAKEGAARE